MNPTSTRWCACDVHNIPCATNLATADLVMSALQTVQPDPKEIHA